MACSPFLWVLAKWKCLLSISLSNEALLNPMTYEICPSTGMREVLSYTEFVGPQSYLHKARTQTNIRCRIPKRMYIILWWNFHDLVHIHCHSSGSKNSWKKNKIIYLNHFSHILRWYILHIKICYIDIDWYRHIDVILYILVKCNKTLPASQSKVRQDFIPRSINHPQHSWRLRPMEGCW